MLSAMMQGSIAHALEETEKNGKVLEDNFQVDPNGPQPNAGCASVNFGTWTYPEVMSGADTLQLYMQYRAYA